jgi:signal transduction histidine kinase
VREISRRRGRVARSPCLGGHANSGRLDGRVVRLELAQVVAAWPLGVSLAAAVIAQGLHAGRRRTALNEALHELRRPLQALALTVPGTGPQEPAAIQGSVQMAATALERLEHEINGDAVRAVRAPLFVHPLLAAAVGRWRSRAELAGSSLSLGEHPGEAMVEGDCGEIAQALDNLIVNAIEHGGPSIVVEAKRRGDRLRVSVGDSGRASRPESRRDNPADVIARLTGRRRHGHGLSVVRRIAASHGGRFVLRRSAEGSLAVLELPLAADGIEQAA